MRRFTWPAGVLPQNPALGAASADPSNRLAQQAVLAGWRSPVPDWPSSDHLKEGMALRGVVYVAVRVLADQAASAEMKIHEWHPDAKMDGDLEAKKPLPRAHELAQLMLHPNRHDSDAMMRRRVVQQLSLTGSSLQWRVDDGWGKPVERWSVPTGTAWPVPLSPQYPEGGYRVTPFYPNPGVFGYNANAGGVVVDAGQMIAIRHPHPLLQKEGLSPLSACDQTVTAVDAIDRSRTSVAWRWPIPSGNVELDPAVDMPDALELLRIERQVLQMIGGPNRAGRPAVFGPGQKWVPSEAKGIELPWVESWNQLVGFALSIFGVTKSMAFMSEDASYAMLYASLKQFNLFTLIPLLEMISEAYNMQLLHPFFGTKYHMEYEPRKINDDELDEKRFSLDYQLGLRTFDEWRVVRELKPVGGDKGKAYVGGTPPPPEGGTPGMPGAAGGDGAALGGKPGQDEGEAARERPQSGLGAGSLPPRMAGMVAGRNGSANGKH